MQVNYLNKIKFLIYLSEMEMYNGLTILNGEVGT